MPDVTLTVSMGEDMSPVKLVNDPSKPGWEDFLRNASVDDDHELTSKPNDSSNVADV